MIAAANRLKDYPVRIEYRREPVESEPVESSPCVPLVWFGLGVLTVVVWTFAIIGMGTVAGWIV